MAYTLAQFLARVEGGHPILVTNAGTATLTLRREAGTTRQVDVVASGTCDLGEYWTAPEVQSWYELIRWIDAGTLTADAGTIPLYNAPLAAYEVIQTFCWCTAGDNPQEYELDVSPRGFKIVEVSSTTTPQIRVDGIEADAAGDFGDCSEAAVVGEEYVPAGLGSVWVYWGAAPSEGDYMRIRIHTSEVPTC